MDSLNLLWMIILHGSRSTDGSDLDLPRLELLGYLACEFDRKQTVFHGCSNNFHVVSQVERLTESPTRDASMHELSLIRWVALSTCYKQCRTMLCQFDVFGHEASKCHRDSIVIGIKLLDVVGRPAWNSVQPAGIVQEAEEAIKANRRTKKGS